MRTFVRLLLPALIGFWLAMRGGGLSAAVGWLPTMIRSKVPYGYSCDTASAGDGTCPQEPHGARAGH